MHRRLIASGLWRCCPSPGRRLRRRENVFEYRCKLEAVHRDVWPTPRTRCLVFTFSARCLVVLHREFRGSHLVLETGVIELRTRGGPTRRTALLSSTTTPSSSRMSDKIDEPTTKPRSLHNRTGAPVLSDANVSRGSKGSSPAPPTLGKRKASGELDERRGKPPYPYSDALQPAFDAEAQLDVKDDLDLSDLVLHSFARSSDAPVEEEAVVEAADTRRVVTSVKQLVAFAAQNADLGAVIDVEIGGFLELDKLSSILDALVKCLASSSTIAIKYRMPMSSTDRKTLRAPLDSLLDIVPESLRSVDWDVAHGKRFPFSPRSPNLHRVRAQLSDLARAMEQTDRAYTNVTWLDIADPGMEANASFHSVTTLEEVVPNVRTLRLSSAFKDRKVVPTKVNLLALVLDQRPGSAGWDKKALWCTLKNLNALHIPTIAVLHPVADLLAAVLAEQRRSIAHILMLQDCLCLRLLGGHRHRWLFTGVGMRAVEELVASDVWASLRHLTIHNRQIDSNIKRFFSVSPKSLEALTIIVTSTTSEPPSANFLLAPTASKGWHCPALKTLTITATISEALDTEGDLLPEHKIPQSVLDGERPTITIREVEAFLSRHRLKKKSLLRVIMNGVDFAEGWEEAEDVIGSKVYRLVWV
ncbi:hypothetical protein EXIGLDRAFT_202141 [Exidia glandulosa HHB12029]|uniref:Uncharacterized protein n=1 Tax=Exidia glandulosa HHB12029 TaxID=1314781 RepID=A0A165EPY9_EXIGL|nr:hypothetical protein EXIGLDRAFT_202141 [Exidia glandulosa HHB12029]